MHSLRRWLAVLLVTMATLTMTACPEANDNEKDEPGDSGYSLRIDR